VLVAAIHVDLPTVCVVAMVVGARGQTYEQVIVKRLAAFEEMPALLILCSGKIGSLTKIEGLMENFHGCSRCDDDLSCYGSFNSL